MRLRSVEATGVLGQFRHEFSFGDSAPYAILYGPNGVGKTKLLELVGAAIRLDPATLAVLPFDSATLTFDDASVLTVIRNVDGDEMDEDHEDADWPAVQFQFSSPNGESHLWSVPSSGLAATSGFLNWLSRDSSWRQVTASIWEDQTDGERITFDELRSRFEDSFPGRSGRKRRPDIEAPQEFRDLLPLNRVHLIETQRLRTIRERQIGQPSSSRESATVQAYSDDIKKQVSRALAQNSRRTQQLDRSFPRRLLDVTNRETPDVEDIRQKYEDQSRIRDRLAQIAVVGIEADFPLPTRELSDWEKTVLWMYLNDADTKLESFSPLLERLDLLEDVLGRRFLNKHIQVNAEEGLAVIGDSDGRRLQLETLSSGEQHELILMYGLLFDVEPGALVLIDEPEISLHVSWQITFMDDVARIAEVANFQFIVATHSPQIINDKWDHAFQLGPGVEL